jgi:hypothetical protein
MERKFTDISDHVNEIYDGFYKDTRKMLLMAERDIPSKVLCREPEKETDPTDSDGRERVMFRFTAHEGEMIHNCVRELKDLQENFRTDTRFSTVHRGSTYCIGVFADQT